MPSKPAGFEGYCLFFWKCQPWIIMILQCFHPRTIISSWLSSLKQLFLGAEKADWIQSNVYGSPSQDLGGAHIHMKQFSTAKCIYSCYLCCTRNSFLFWVLNLAFIFLVHWWWINRVLRILFAIPSQSNLHHIAYVPEKIWAVVNTCNLPCLCESRLCIGDGWGGTFHHIIFTITLKNILGWKTVIGPKQTRHFHSVITRELFR